MWPVSVRFHAQLLLRVEGEPVYVMNEDLLGATSFDAFKSVTLAGSVDKIGTVLAAKHKRAVLSQTTASLGRVYTVTQEDGAVVETEVGSDYSYSLAASQRRRLHVCVELRLTPAGAKQG